MTEVKRRSGLKLVTLSLSVLFLSFKASNFQRYTPKLSLLFGKKRTEGENRVRIRTEGKGKVERKRSECELVRVRERQESVKCWRERVGGVVSGPKAQSSAVLPDE